MDDNQECCLRWIYHQSTLVTVFNTFLENGTFVDCTLAAEGKSLHAHKVVLSACSPYFEALLSKHYDKHPILILKDVKFQELKVMMDYMYRGEVVISQDQLGALLEAAESLQIKGLLDNRKGDAKPAIAPSQPKSLQPISNMPKIQGLTIEHKNRKDTRKGSQSPGSQKKKRIRRKSEELDNHDHQSNSSESHSNHGAPAQNILISLPAPIKLAADVPEPIEAKDLIGQRSDILIRPKQNDEQPPPVPIIKEKIETHTERMLEPKSKYVEEINEDCILDLNLDVDDISNLTQIDDGAGPSHGSMAEGLSQEIFTGPTFDREDIKVNQRFPEVLVHLTSGYKISRSRKWKRSWSSSSSYSSNDEHKKLYRNKSKKNRYPSRSPIQVKFVRSRNRSNSSSSENNERSPKNNRQRSTSKNPQKIPGCYIPTNKEIQEARERSKRRRRLMGIHSKRKKSPSSRDENESMSYGERKDKRSPRRRSSSFSPQRRRRRSHGSDSHDGRRSSSFSPQRRRRRSHGSDSHDGRRYDRRRNRRGEEIISNGKKNPADCYPAPKGLQDENYWPGPAPYVSSSFFPYSPMAIRPPGIPLFNQMPFMIHPPHMGMPPRFYNRPYRPLSIRAALSETEKTDKTAGITKLDN